MDLIINFTEFLFFYKKQLALYLFFW